MKKVIIFDFDNTLVLSLPHWKQMIDHETAKHYNVSENPDFEPNRHGFSNKDTAKMFVEMHDVEGITYEDVVDYWYDYMEVKYRDEIDYIEGAEWVLEYLKSKGYTLVLATATGKKLLTKAFRIFDVEKYFDLVMCEEDVGKSKKDPDIFIKIMERLNVKPEECIYFEDSYIAINTALSLGIECVAIVSELNEKHEKAFEKTCLAVSRSFSPELIKKVGL